MKKFTSEELSLSKEKRIHSLIRRLKIMYGKEKSDGGWVCDGFYHCLQNEMIIHSYRVESFFLDLELGLNEDGRVVVVAYAKLIGKKYFSAICDAVLFNEKGYDDYIEYWNHRKEHKALQSILFTDQCEEEQPRRL